MASGPVEPAHAAPVLQIKSIAWDVLGLDSNKPAPPNNEGPEIFPVGYRVCNLSTTDTATDVTVTFNWQTTPANPALEPPPNLPRGAAEDEAGNYIYIQAGNLTSLTHPTLAVNSAGGAFWEMGQLGLPDYCADFYFNVQVARDTDSWYKYRWYQVAVDSAEGVTTALDNHYFYVEKLVEQNRNYVDSLTGPSVVVVGETYKYTLTGKTQDFEQVVLSADFPNNVFVVAVDTWYGGTPPTAVNNSMYADPCVWDPYNRECTTAGKMGGDIQSDIYVGIRDAPSATITLNPLIYDMSGSSYHYFMDLTLRLPIVVVHTPAIELSKTVYVGHDSGAGCPTNTTDYLFVPAGTPLTYCFTVTNNGTDSYLNDVVLSDPQLAEPIVNLSGTFPLAPAASAIYYAETTFTGASVNNVATATATGYGWNSVLNQYQTIYRPPELTQEWTVTDDDGAVVTPVTLSYFAAARDGDTVTFDWSTALEIGNVGFNLYVQNGGELQRINDELIASYSIDSAEPRDYSFSASGVVGDVFFIEDVNIYNQSSMHGPFNTGEVFGARTAADRIDWAAIRVAHEAAAQEYTMAGPDVAAMSGGYPVYDVRVSRSGLYRITYEDLAAAGLDLAGVPASDIALTSRGAPVRIRVEGDPFGPGAFIEFYGEALDTLYTDTNVYQLQIDAALARRVKINTDRPPSGEVPDYYKETAVLDRERGYGFSSPLGDPWYDTNMLVYTTPKSWEFDLQIDNFVAGGSRPKLTVNMYGNTDWPDYDPDHHVTAALNGQTVGEALFNGVATSTIKAKLASGVLQEGSNTLTLTLPADTGADFEVVRFNSATITYPRAFVARDGVLAFEAKAAVFEVTNLPSSDVVVYQIRNGKTTLLSRAEVTEANGTYTARFPGSSKSALYVVSTADALLKPVLQPSRPQADITGGTADFLVIAHPDFLAGIQPLVDAREAQGFSTRVVNVEDVYAQFGYSIFDPQAIRDYIAYAVPNMGVRWVLLVGGDTYDYRNYLNSGSISFIPTLYIATDALVQFAPSDPLFADIDGDLVPDVALGRFPVRTAAELETLVNKTLAYDSKDYGQTAVFAADAGADGAWFREDSEAFAAGLPEGWSVERAYLDDVGVAAARAALINAINSGVALTSFVGHSSADRWTFSGLFFSSDAAALTNAGRPTVVNQWGCWNTYFVSPAYNTLGHRFLLSGDRGAVVVMGASTLTASSSEAVLGQHMMPLLTQPGMTIGEAMQQAKAEMAAVSKAQRDVLLGWTILGDPTLVIDR
jgi:hypothetical protein